MLSRKGRSFGVVNVKQQAPGVCVESYILQYHIMTMMHPGESKLLGLSTTGYTVGPRYSLPRMAAAVMQPDRAALAQRIQGFGNVNPPPVEDETASPALRNSLSQTIIELPTSYI